MTEMIVYFARSIRGVRFPADQHQEQTILKIIRRYGTPALELPSGKHGGTQDQFIYERDINWLGQSHALIAEVSNPSLGVGYEIAVAQNRGIPVLALARRGFKVSAMIAGNAGIQFRYYTPEDLGIFIGGFLEHISEKLAGGK